MSANVSAPVEADLDVLIVGAGLSGVGAAWHLQHRCPDQSYLILESRESLGGTWDLFRYPGIRSDSDMYTFGYAFRPWTDGKVFADGPSIRNYVNDTAEEAGIAPIIRYQHKVVGAHWSTEDARWTVEVAVGESGAIKRYTAKFVFLCSGYYRYDRGYMPDFPGMADFKGDVIHPQHWPEGYDYTGKRVVVIGSGATAVTLVPAMSDTARHVTMLQRSPTYIAARPSVDKTADFLRKVLPAKTAYGLTRIKNVLQAILIFQMSRRWPDFVKKGVLKAIQEQLGEDFDVEKHFSPSYRPWDQRFCLAPEGDFFDVLKSGEASIVTDQIERFTENGILLKSGETLEADLIIPATGLEMQVGGGMDISVDGQPFVAPDHVTYRGMMLSDVPNLALAFGYTNASWTLKVDLTAERVCRLINHMKARNLDYVVPTPPEGLETLPLLDFSSGYVQRALPTLPRQGATPPWRTYQNYLQDMFAIRYGKLEDGHVRFGTAGDQVFRAGAPLTEAAE
ncbi:monooxygenase, flavin-binding family protein [Oceanicaulis sp. HTCC2633]|uniref:flavin-containing monooxygenase n=1 Tax=Oceanicaulis sp. HTCC2633 TaxID=314254 RepID=UPI000066A0F5|nr:NAD(P)/FAD-dependent oxidoreductase [Oceanicaulis sp. HTCC2633]EAP90188.1 monooxygenase, flavin-binding family protein [Oceanicaulis sp. HTCC2633]